MVAHVTERNGPQAAGGHSDGGRRRRQTTHLELLVELAAVSVQHGQVERAKVGVETGQTHGGKPVSAVPAEAEPRGAGGSHLLLVDKLVVRAEVVRVGRAFGFAS